MRIAVIADTHDRVPPKLFDLIAGADEIWHLGDVCAEAVLNDFVALGPPLKIVRGNCDSCTDWPLSIEFNRAGLQIQLVHIPPAAAPEGTNLLLHGHTHVPRNELVRNARFLNPGCISRSNRGAPRSFLWLELNSGRPPALAWTLLDSQTR